MAQFKGTIFIATKLFTEQTYGAHAVERCMQALEPADRMLLAGISAVGWYPVEPILRYHHALEKLYGQAGAGFEVCERLGTFSAEWAINSILKVFIRFKSPLFLMEKNSTVWGRYHDTGRWEMGPQGKSPQGKNHLSGKLHDFEVRDPAFCARLRGWIRGAVQMTGGKDVRIAEPFCRCRGAEYCEFEIEWR